MVAELNYPEDAYCINGDTQEFGSINLSTAEFSAIGAAAVSPYFLIVEEYNGNAIYRALLGKAYFGTLDLENYNFTTISTKSNCKIIAIAGDGYVYGPTVNQDNLYKINPTTGDFSAVGNTRFDMKFGQDVSYDIKEDKFYSPAIIHPGDAFFGTYNLNTGALSQVTDIQDRIITFVITKSLDDNIAECTTKIEASVVPNPTQGMLHVEAQGGYKVEIIDIMGRVIYSTYMQNILNIDISDAKTGIYVLRLSNAEASFIHKIVKE